MRSMLVPSSSSASMARRGRGSDGAYRENTTIPTALASQFDCGASGRSGSRVAICNFHRLEVRRDAAWLSSISIQFLKLRLFQP